MRTRPSEQLKADLIMMIMSTPMYVRKLFVVQKKTNIIQVLCTKLQMSLQRWTYPFKRDLYYSTFEWTIAVKDSGIVNQ